MQPFLAYHDVSGSTHQTHVDELSPQGFRPISVNVSGDPSDARYAAVWVQRPGPPWAALHNIDAEAYQANFDRLTRQGYVPVIVSATGPVENAVFAAIFEQDGTPAWFARHGLRFGPESDPDTLIFENNHAFRDEYIPRCLSVYGTPEDRRFAGVWVDNHPRVDWAWWFADGDTHQDIFNAEVLAGARPSFVSVSPDRVYLSVFKDDQIGQWVARHDITAADYQHEFDTQLADGLMPIMVQAGGSGSATRYAALFAVDDSIFPRQWSMTGFSDRQLEGLEAVVREIMAGYGIRAGSLAVAHGALRLSQGYTWAEESFPMTSSEALLRIASLSKIFTAAAIAQLIDEQRLRLDTRAYAFLGITSPLLPDQVPDPAVAQITVQQLIDHRSGLNQAELNEGGTVRKIEPLGDLRAIAKRIGTTSTPTRKQIVRLMFGEKPDFAPGSHFAYSNFGYLLLTELVSVASGRSFIDYVREHILAREGLSGLTVGATAIGGGLAGEVFYNNVGVSLSVLQPAANFRAPNAYGGAFFLENSEGTGGLVTSAALIANFISRHAVWGMGGRVVNTRYGRLDGTTGISESRGDGFDYTLLINKLISDPECDQVRNKISAYLDAHPVG